MYKYAVHNVLCNIFYRNSHHNFQTSLNNRLLLLFRVTPNYRHAVHLVILQIHNKP